MQYEVNPLCVLDFYIHESHQRTGCGKKMFEHMLKVYILILITGNYLVLLLLQLVLPQFEIG